jgi:primosomal protein N' (replication factor Y) (superfamily II helicase)
MQTVHVIVPTLLDRGFDYRLESGEVAGVGSIVAVPLRGRMEIGVVVGAARDNMPVEKLKSIAQIFSHLPPFSIKFLEYLQRVAEYTVSPIGAVMKLAIPSARIFTHPPKLAWVPPVASPAHPQLSTDQARGCSQIISLPEHAHKTFVIDGVTGSGKTELYTGAMLQILERDPTAQILVLLPEIALTHQWLSRFERYFGYRPLVWHSGIGVAARSRTYRAMMDGSARVVVGARSALFLPFADLKMIIVDEEHEPSYKQEDGVTYHARDMAVLRGAMLAIPVVLVSATPSLETQMNIETSKYERVHLPNRHGGALMPSVSLIDMRSETLERGEFISPTLRSAMIEALSRGEQRGYAPLVLCRACGHRFQCPSCSAWLVLHQRRGVTGLEIKQGRLHCHHCGHHEPVPEACPSCKVEEALIACGPGVERVAEEVRRLLPDARVSLLSSDNGEAKEEIDAIIARERDIIIGTQMVAKGHHFPHLSTVGVIDADLGLTGADIRASERSFQLLHQVSGRAGREAVAGHVYLQTYVPEHPVMQALAAADATAFYALERQGRKSALLPPYGQLASILLDGANEREVQQVAQMLMRTAPRDARLQLLGPAPAALSRLKGQYRYRIIVKAARGIHLQAVLRSWIDLGSMHKRVRVKIDINPQSFM